MQSAFLVTMDKNHSKGSAVFQLKVLIVAVLACVSLRLEANPGMDFYSGTVPVNDRSQPAFSQGMNEALLQVLVKSSAEQPEKLRQNPRLAEELSNGERFAAQFLYKTQADIQPGGTVKNQLYLQAAFPEKIIMALLKKASVRFWPSRRAPVLLLPVINVGGLAHIAHAGDTGVNESLLKASQEYGIPVIMGGEQQEDAALLWNADITYTNKIAAAYGCKTALVVQIAGSAVTGRWYLVDGTELTRQEVGSDTQANFASKGMAWAANQLASKQAVALNSAASKIDLLVSGIDDYDSYENVTAYLKNITIVEQLNLTKVEPGFLSATLILTTGIDQLEKIFQADKKITVTTSESGQKTFRWNE